MTLSTSHAAGDTILAADINAIAAAVNAISSYTDEQVRDVIGTALVAGTGVTITVNDAADTITIASTGGGGAATTNRVLGLLPTASLAAHASYPLTGMALASVTNSGAVSTSSGSRITDGDIQLTGTYGDGRMSGWLNDTTLTFDLGTAQTVSELYATGLFGSAGARMPLGFTVDSSPDNVTWTNRYTHTPIAAQGQPGIRVWSHHNTFTGASARYWRVLVDADPLDINLISELQLLG